MNTVALLGNITNDINIKYTKDGATIASFSIAVNRKYRKADGTMAEEVSFFDAVAFGKTGEVIGQYFGKGSRILITGRLKQERWTAQDGTNRSKVVIVVDGFDFIDRKTEEAYRPNNHQPRPQESPAELPEIDVDEDEIPF